MNLAREIVRFVESAKPERGVLLAPPFLYLPFVREVIEGSGVFLGAQDLSAHEDGAFTADVSARMLLDAGCSHVIVGHSERREHNRDSDELIGQKVRRALDAGLGVILCIGEKEEERLRGDEKRVVERQYKAGVADVSLDEATNMITIAYEPVWAIGTGRTATPKDASLMHAFIRESVGERFGNGVAQNTQILYGGSVKAANAADLLQNDEIDGALVGGASLDSDSFTAIISAR